METILLRTGLIGEAHSKVTAAESAIAMKSGSVNAYASPAMIALMEAAAVAAVDSNLPQGTVSVGIEVAVKHIAATPIGENITAIAEVTRIDGRRVHLEVRAWDERELIGMGTHIRYIVQADDFAQRLQRPQE